MINTLYCSKRRHWSPGNLCINVIVTCSIHGTRVSMQNMNYHSEDQWFKIKYPQRLSQICFLVFSMKKTKKKKEQRQERGKTLQWVQTPQWHKKSCRLVNNQSFYLNQNIAHYTNGVVYLIWFYWVLLESGLCLGRFLNTPWPHNYMWNSV